MSKLLEYLVENEPAFRKARLPALYSDFQPQRTLNPDGYQANVSAWRRALARLVRAGLAPSPRAAAANLLVLECDEALLRALESKQYGRPLALGAVVREALAAQDLVPLRDFLTTRESIYARRGNGGAGSSWSVWGLAAWTMRQIGVADLSLPSLMGKGEGGETLPAGQFVVVANVEETAQRFGEQSEGLQSRFERTFSRAHFYKTFNGQLAEDAAGRSQHLSEADADVLLTFLSRDKGAVLYDGKTVKIKAPGEAALTAITDEDVSIAQLKELLEYLTHQTALLGKRVEELTAAAKDAVVKKNRVAALAALKSKKLAESTLERRFATVNQLEEVAAKIEQAVDNVQLVKVMESSSEALRSLHAQVGGVEGVEDVVDRLREQTAAADEVNSILAESAGTMVVDEGEIDDELAALEGEETRKLAQAERQKQETEQARREAEQTREAEEIRKRLDAVEKLSAQQEQEERRAPAEAEAQAAERLMSRMSLDERPEPQAAT